MITGIVFLALYSKETIHLSINGWHHPVFDFLFKYITYLGDGWVFAGAFLILIFIKWRYVTGLIMAALLTLLLTGFFKQVVFKGEPRPVKYFEGEVNLRQVDGVDIHHYQSLPSGHTTTAFACFGFLALLANRAGVMLFCFLIAAAVGYSRVYLSQHFLLDVVAGAFLGTFIALLAYYLMRKLNWPANEARLRPFKT
ncbi:MAG: phosphatase PAP2 family protein [Owenweeksia sp.]|nr:phosphatase PAP2 family protein [Owenweeksia sp.]